MEAQINSPITHQILADAAVTAEIEIGKYKLSDRTSTASLAPNPPGVKKAKNPTTQAKTYAPVVIGSK